MSEEQTRPAWFYHRGYWEEISDPWAQQEEGDIAEELGRLGFGRFRELSLGWSMDDGEPNIGLEVWEAENPVDVDGPLRVRFCALWLTSQTFHQIFITDLPSLLQFVGEFQPLLASVVETETLRLAEAEDERTEAR